MALTTIALLADGEVRAAVQLRSADDAAHAAAALRDLAEEYESEHGTLPDELLLQAVEGQWHDEAAASFVAQRVATRQQLLSETLHWLAAFAEDAYAAADAVRPLS